MQALSVDGRQGTGGSPPSIVQSPFLCGGSTLDSSGRNRLGSSVPVAASPFADAGGLVDSRRTSVPGGTTGAELPELVPPWVLGPPRAFATSGTLARTGGGAEPGVLTGASRTRAWCSSWKRAAEVTRRKFV